MAEPPRAEPYSYYGYHGNTLPLGVLANALEIVRDHEERAAQAHYLLDMTLRQQAGDMSSRSGVAEEFERALELGEAAEWCDDALFDYARG